MLMFRCFVVYSAIYVLLGLPAIAGEMWDCDYVHTSRNERDFEFHQRFEVEKGELRLAKGGAHFQIMVNNDIALTAAGGDVWNSPVNGQTASTKIIAIHKKTGQSLRTVVLLTNRNASYVTDRGSCHKVARYSK